MTLSAAAPLALAGVLGIAWLTLPPVVRLPAGTHEGPLVLDRPQRLVGEDGAIVRGGIVIRSDDVSVRNVTVLGGENGIDVDFADDIVLDGVRVLGSTMDGIHVRRSHVTIRDCDVASLASEYGQGIDISFSFDRDPSLDRGLRDRRRLGGNRLALVAAAARGQHRAGNDVARDRRHGDVDGQRRKQHGRVRPRNRHLLR